MKKTTLFIAIAFLALNTMLVSCKKDEDNNTPTPSSAPALPQPSDADGVLAAVNTEIKYDVPFVGETFILQGIGLAAFVNTTGAWSDLADRVSGGTVTLNSQDLPYTNGTHFYTPQATSGTPSEGLDFASDGVNWSVSGAGTVPSFTHTTPTTVPDVPRVTSATTVSKASAYTIQHQYISGADSILYVIASGNKTLTKTLVGYSTSCPFTAAEIGTLDKSDYALIQVNAYRVTSAIKSGKKYYFVNQGTGNIVGAKVTD